MNTVRGPTLVSCESDVAMVDPPCSSKRAASFDINEATLAVYPSIIAVGREGSQAVVVDVPGLCVPSALAKGVGKHDSPKHTEMPNIC